MSHRHSAVVTVRRVPEVLIKGSGIGHITAQVRLHWPETAEHDELTGAALDAVEQALRLALIGRTEDAS